MCVCTCIDFWKAKKNSHHYSRRYSRRCCHQHHSSYDICLLTGDMCSQTAEKDAVLASATLNRAKLDLADAGPDVGALEPQAAASANRTRRASSIANDVSWWAQMSPRAQPDFRREGVRLAVGGDSAECCRGFVRNFARASLPRAEDAVGVRGCPGSTWSTAPAPRMLRLLRSC